MTIPKRIQYCNCIPITEAERRQGRLIKWHVHGKFMSCPPKPPVVNFSSSLTVMGLCQCHWCRQKRGRDA